MIFNKLAAIDCSKNIEKKNGLSYLSWAWAWGLVKTEYPTANYKVKTYDGKPYLHDEALGYMVGTEVTIDGETIEMHLPVMDYKNRAMKSAPYSNRGEVAQATMFDINTAIMRCLVKNLAMFGLGHYIYAGEDLPKVDDYKAPVKVSEKTNFAKLIDEAKTVSDLMEIWDSCPENKREEIKPLLMNKKEKL